MPWLLGQGIEIMYPVTINTSQPFKKKMQVDVFSKRSIDIFVYKSKLLKSENKTMEDYLNDKELADRIDKLCKDKFPIELFPRLNKKRLFQLLVMLFIVMYLVYRLFQ
jgi:hypothetical protein